MDRGASRRFRAGRVDYTVAWVLLTFLIFSTACYRFYMAQAAAGIIYLCTMGLLGIGYLYDFWR